MGETDTKDQGKPQLQPGQSSDANQGTPLAQEGQSSDAKDGSTSPAAPQLVTLEHLQKLVSDALTEQGRKHKIELESIVKERDTLKSELQAKTVEIEDVGQERESLKTQIDELSSGDPKKFDLIKRDRELRDRERKLKNDAQALETERQKHTDRVKKAEAFEREVLIQRLVENYEGSDFEKLKDLCDVFGASSEEQIMKVADTLWKKKEGDNPPAGTQPYSGITSGGRQQIRNKVDPDETLRKGFQHLKR